MNYQIVCDFRESFSTQLNTDVLYNDHPKRDSVVDIQTCIQELGHTCEIFGGIDQLIDAYNSKTKLPNDIYINLSDGLTQPYSRVQAPILLEMLGVKYSGATPFVAALVNNKYYTKLALREIGIFCPKDMYVCRATELHRGLLQDFSFPVIVKPNAEGSSVGISKKSICYDEESALIFIDYIRTTFEQVIIEEYIEGYEITDFILGNQNNFTLNEPIMSELGGRIFFNDEVMGAEEKAFKSRKQFWAGEVLPCKLVEDIQNTTEKIVNHIGLYDIARADYRVTKDNKIAFLEVNSAPRISRTSELGVISKFKHIEFEDVINMFLIGISNRLKPN